MKRCGLYFLFPVIFMAAACQGGKNNGDLTTENEKDMLTKETALLIGTYTGEGPEDSKGIYRIWQSSEDGSLRMDSLIASISNPTFLALSPNHRFLYSVGEGISGTTTAYRIDSGLNLSELNTLESQGEHPCHVITDPEQKMVIVTNYSSGSVTVYSIQTDGRISGPTQHIQYEGKGEHSRQERPHAHQTCLSPNGRFAYVQDLGTDKTHMYRIDAENKKLIPLQPESISYPAGSGPRHMVFHPKLPFAYVITELGNTVHAFKHDGETGLLTETDHYSTLPEDWKGENYPADIHISPDGKFLYGSNRGHNSLAIYKINVSDGTLTTVGFESVRGDWPRNFYITRGGEYIYVANQRSNNIVGFDRHPGTGELTPNGVDFKEISAPVCIIDYVE